MSMELLQTQTLEQQQEQELQERQIHETKRLQTIDDYFMLIGTRIFAEVRTNIRELRLDQGSDGELVRSIISSDTAEWQVTMHLMDKITDQHGPELVKGMAEREEDASREQREFMSDSIAKQVRAAIRSWLKETKLQSKKQPSGI